MNYILSTNCLPPHTYTYAYVPRCACTRATPTYTCKPVCAVHIHMHTHVHIHVVHMNMYATYTCAHLYIHVHHPPPPLPVLGPLDMALVLTPLLTLPLPTTLPHSGTLQNGVQPPFHPAPLPPCSLNWCLVLKCHTHTTALACPTCSLRLEDTESWLFLGPSSCSPPGLPRCCLVNISLSNASACSHLLAYPEIPTAHRAGNCCFPPGTPSRLLQEVLQPGRHQSFQKAWSLSLPSSLALGILVSEAVSFGLWTQLPARSSSI